jgi:hypothetical protein
MLSLRNIEELYTSTLGNPKVYRGCLSPKERKIMAEIYREANLKPIKPSSGKFDRIRKAW